jgi:type I restriction-modification
MKKYDEYKDSGVAWIGEVPKHWEVKKMNYHCSTITDFVASGSFADLKRNVQYLGEPDYAMLIRTVDLSSNDKKQPPVYISKSSYEFLSNSNLVGGEIILPNIGAVGNVYIVPKLYKHMSLAPNAIMVRSYGNDKFLYYYFKSKPGVDSLTLIGISTVQDKFNKTELRSLRVLVPPVTEQTAIATYLDTHCAKIDNLISIQQKRIALLQELKQSVITHAVTKGLNPNVEMKQSGVEWIGDVPKHWEVMPIKYIADTNSGATPKNIKGRQNERSDIKWVRTTDLSDICDYVYDSSEYLSREEMKSASCPWLPKNTVVVAMYGGSGTIGKAGILGCDSTINQALCSLETTKLEDYRYLYYNIKSLRPYWMKLAASSRKDPNISQEIIRNMDVPVPGIDEQTKIVQYLDRKCTTINTSISNAQHQIDLLQEYKQSLITEVVTGKRKVTDN